MKKRYQIPTAEVMKIETTCIIAASLTETAGADGLGKGDDWTQGAANSRDGDFWDEQFQETCIYGGAAFSVRTWGVWPLLLRQENGARY